MPWCRCIIPFANLSWLRRFLVLYPSSILPNWERSGTKNALEALNKDEKEHLLEVGKRTWQFFRDHLNEQGNYLPPDNYQEDRKEKVAYRTSPTNIGLALLAVASSYDLKWEDANFVLNLYEKMFPSIEKLPKWNGHLYNWYNIQTLTATFSQIHFGCR